MRLTEIQVEYLYEELRDLVEEVEGVSSLVDLQLSKEIRKLRAKLLKVREKLLFYPIVDEEG